MTITVGVFEAKNTLSELIERAARGEDVVITRRGEPIVRLVPAHSSTVEAALEEFLDIRGRTRPGDESVRELIEEGRRW